MQTANARFTVTFQALVNETIEKRSAVVAESRAPISVTLKLVRRSHILSTITYLNSFLEISTCCHTFM